jgi:hypothetical protein
LGPSASGMEFDTGTVTWASFMVYCTVDAE